MNALRVGTLAGALTLAAALSPAPVARGQSVEPADPFESAVQAYELLGRGVHLGVTVRDVEEGDAKQAKAGVIIEEVTSGGPAEKAGMKTGDAITEFDGERVRSVRQFTRLVQETAGGRNVPVVLSRGGQRVTVNVTPDATGFGDDFRLRLLDIPRAAAPPAPPAAPRPPRPARPPSVFNDWFYSDGPMTSLSGRGRLGITMESLDGQLAEYFGVKEGALVKSVVDDSAAAKAGIKAGDVITSFNGTRVYDASDVSRAINRMDGPGDSPSRSCAIGRRRR